MDMQELEAMQYGRDPQPLSLCGPVHKSTGGARELVAGWTDHNYALTGRGMMLVEELREIVRDAVGLQRTEGALPSDYRVSPFERGRDHLGQLPYADRKGPAADMSALDQRDEPTARKDMKAYQRCVDAVARARTPLHRHYRKCMTEYWFWTVVKDQTDRPSSNAADVAYFYVTELA